MSRLESIACEQEYEGVEQMLNRICWKFIKTHGGDWDELKSVANLAFIKAWDNYNDSRSAFTTYCWCYAWGYLMNYTTCRLKQKVNLEANETIGYRPTLLEELSEDANTVVRIVFGFGRYEENHRPMKLRNRIRVHLMEQLGWSIDRITESFEEIREALR